MIPSRGIIALGVVEWLCLCAMAVCWYVCAEDERRRQIRKRKDQG